MSVRCPPLHFPTRNVYMSVVANSQCVAVRTFILMDEAHGNDILKFSSYHEENITYLRLL